MPVNYRNLRLELDRQAPDAIYRKVKPLMVAEFEERKKQVLEEFESDPITQELRAGPDANSSVVNVKNGGNLYSLIGFQAGTEPTEIVKEVLERDLRLNTSQISRQVGPNTITFSIPTRSPTLDDFHGKVEKWQSSVGAFGDAGNWPARAYTEMLERGVPGLPQYLYEPDRSLPTSRSGPAVQIHDGKLRDGSMPRTPYVSRLLALFRRLIGGKE